MVAGSVIYKGIFAVLTLRGRECVEYTAKLVGAVFGDAIQHWFNMATKSDSFFRVKSESESNARVNIFGQRTSVLPF